LLKSQAFGFAFAVSKYKLFFRIIHLPPIVYTHCWKKVAYIIQPKSLKKVIISRGNNSSNEIFEFSQRKKSPIPKKATRFEVYKPKQIKKGVSYVLENPLPETE